MSRSRIISGILTALFLVTGGCHNNSTPPPSNPPPPPAAPGYSAGIRHDSPQPATGPADEDIRGTAEVLAQKAANYAKTVEPLLNQRGGASTEPSVATAIDPDALSLGSQRANAHPRRTAANESRSVPPETKPAGATGQNAHSNGAESRTQIATTDGGIPPEISALTVGDLDRKLSQHVKDYPQDLPGQLDYQLLQLVRGEAVPQLPVIAGLNSEDREVLAALMDGISNFRTSVRADGNLLLSKKVRPLLELGERLRSQAELTIPVVALCRKVDGFGVYEPIEPTRFPAGRENPAIVYCEVENFSSQLDEQKRWTTMLAEEVVLYDEQNGLEVWREKQTRSIVDYSRNRRHDFFLVKMIKLPANLTIGRYLLKVSVVDQQVQRVAENTVAVEIVAQ